MAHTPQRCFQYSYRPWPGHAARGLLVLGLLALTACGRVHAVEGPAQDLPTLYETALRVPHPAAPALSQPPGAGEAEMSWPVQPATVQRVWIPAQRSAEGDLVGGHWVYMLLEPAQWRLDAPPQAAARPLRVPLAPLPSATSPPSPAVDPRPAAPVPPAGATPPADRRAQPGGLPRHPLSGQPTAVAPARLAGPMAAQPTLTPRVPPAVEVLP
jgi:hypothetical protein